MMVRFATTCDVVTKINGGTRMCGKRSIEYVAFPSCRECYANVCPEHQVPGTLVEDEGRNACLCLECRTAEAE